LEISKSKFTNQQVNYQPKSESQISEKDIKIIDDLEKHVIRQLARFRRTVTLGKKDGIIGIITLLHIIYFQF
jgi:hypothetical protein